MKYCSKCEQVLPKSEFVKRKDAKDGLSYHCKRCVRAYKESRKEHLKEYNKEYQQANKERLAIKAREEYQAGGRRKMYAKEYSLTARGKFSTYKTAAKSRNLPFNITFEEFEEFWRKPCFYCGGNIETVGIDRINSEIGYESENLTSCCTECNLMKRHHTLDYFKDKVCQIYKHLKLN